MKKTLTRLALPLSAPPAPARPAVRRLIWTRLIGGLTLLTLLTCLGLFVSSRPARTAGGPIPVTVANTVPTTAADGPAKQPFQASTFYVITPSYTQGHLDSAEGYSNIAVPAGKRLVIQTVSVYEDNANGQNMQAFIYPLINGIRQGYALPPVPDSGTTYPGVTQSMTLSTDPGSTIIFGVFRSGTAGTNYVTLTVYGYLVDAP